jgi:Sugar phosphate permease
MERLKSVLADKILNISSIDNTDEMKSELDKIQRFRDFASACKTFMVKYPAIEDELIEMADNGNFDTQIASSRVDRIIKLIDGETVSAVKLSAGEENIPVGIEKKEKPLQLVDNNVANEDENLFPSEEEMAATRRKVNIRRIAQLIGVMLVVAILIIVVKFVVHHWQTILIIAGIIAVLALMAIWFIWRKRD